jgi:hypothetical protein
VTGRSLGQCLAAAIAVALLVVAGLPTDGSAASATTGDIGYADASYVGATYPPTSDKPESKLWFNDGLWWADMFDTGSGTWHIFRLDRAAESWVDTGTVLDPRVASLADVLWDGTHLYVASHFVTVSTHAAPKTSVSGEPSLLYRLSYDAEARAYAIDDGYPTQISNTSSESLTIDKDSTGLVWATWTEVSGSSTIGYTSSVYVNSTVDGDRTWGTPQVVPVSGAHPAPDDISAVVAFAKDKIGVLWSNQLDDTVYWAVHNDAQAATVWHGGVAVHGPNLADDHMNLKTMQADSSGRVFAAVKTSLDESPSSTSNDAQLDLLVYRPGTGSWSTTVFGTVADCHTRPLLLLDTTNSMVHVFATAPTAGGCPYSGAPGTIYEKSAAMDNPVFPAGRGTPVIRDSASANMNNVASTKQSVDAASGIVALASNDVTRRYWHADLSLPGPVTPSGPVTPPGPVSPPGPVTPPPSVSGTPIRLGGLQIVIPAPTYAALPSQVSGRAGVRTSSWPRATAGLNGATVVLQGRGKPGTAWRNIGRAEVTSGHFTVAWHPTSTVHALRVRLLPYASFTGAQRTVPRPGISSCHRRGTPARWSIRCATTAGNGTAVRLLKRGKVVQRTAVARGHVTISGRGKRSLHAIVVRPGPHALRLHL